MLDIEYYCYKNSLCKSKKIEFQNHLMEEILKFELLIYINIY